MMRHVMSVLIGLVVFFGVSRVEATVYHVAGTGVDAASGSSTSPWRTLSKANSAAVAGDVVIVHGGQYADGIHPSNSGRAGSPIMFQVAPGERAVLNTRTGVQLGTSSHYIVIDGFEIHASVRVVELVGSSYITIRNCTMFGGRGNYSGFSLDNASYCVIQNNYYDRQDPVGSTQVGDNPGGGDGLRLISGSNHNLVEGNTVTRCEHVAFASSFSKANPFQSYNVWRNNTAYNNHTNFSLQDGVQRCLFENNTGYYMGQVWTGGNGWCLQFTGTNCILRFNTLYDDTATVYTNRQWPGTVGTMTGSANGGTPSMQYNKVYNNTIYGETDQREWKKDGWRWENYRNGLVQSDNAFKNNVVAAAGANQINDIDDFQSLAAMNNRYEGNLLYGANGQPALIRYEYSGGNSVLTLDQAKRSKPAQWTSTNKEGNPLFVDTRGQGPAKDFHLQQGSPAIDAGVHLTTTTSGGNGTTLVVADGGYFIDGWGIPGVQGDSIKIESDAPVGIVKADYSTNTLTLNSPRSWAAGARVFYYRSDRFQGNAPDIGALEFGGESLADRGLGRNMLTNSDFEAGTSAWTFYTNGTGSMQQVSPGFSGAEAVRLTISQTGSNMQLYQSNLPLEANTNYRLTFAAYCNSGHGMDVAYQQNGPPYANYGLKKQVALTTSWALYSMDFSSTAPSAISDARLMFWLGSYATSGDEYWIDHVILEKVGWFASAPPSDKPLGYALLQNFPNPFNPSTLIQYSLASAGRVSLKVFNLLGEEIASLVDEEQSAGFHEVRFDAKSLPNGTYFCRMQTATFKQTKKMLLLK